MERSQLEAILNDSASTPEEKAAAQAALGAKADPLTDLEAALLQAVRKSDLASVPYHDIRTLYEAHGFSEPARELYERWLCASEVGLKGIERAAEYLRKHDFEAWDGAMREWKASGWKSMGRLISVLELIADSPNRGNYHSEEAVRGAAKFLVEMKRRTGEAQP